MSTADAHRGERLGDLLVSRGRLTREKLERALRLQEESGQRLGLLLVQFGDVAEPDLAEVLSEQLEFPLARPENFTDLPDLGEQISPDFMRRARFVPIALDGSQMTVAMEDPTDAYTLAAIELATGKSVRAWLAAPGDIATALQRRFGSEASTLGEMVEADTAAPDDIGDIQHLRDLASEAPIIRVVNTIVSKALAMRASDIHIEPFEHLLKVRYRVDGVLREGEAPPAHSAAAVISRVKVMARLNIAERRLPQDGRMKLRMQGRVIDIRVSSVPTMFGESVVLRILDKSRVPLEFNALGFTPDILPAFEALVGLPHGIMLVTGPTGSGKTTTLYAALETLNTPDRKILTVEDPVEYQLNGINQVQIKPQIGLNFANALRSMLRQDPDVIMVGEMRDAETAAIAVQSALTGHKVFSTLHTNDAPSSVTRLLEMGVEDFLLTSTISGVLAQRLVRTLCRECRERCAVPAGLHDEIVQLHPAARGDPILYQPRGCESCDHTGYQGRTCIVELMVFSEPLRKAVLKRGDAGALRRVAVENGMRTMYRDGLCKALAGVTTVEEVVRVTREQ